MSRPWETAGEPFVDVFLRLLGYAGKSGADLLYGTLNLKHCFAAFARKLPTLLMILVHMRLYLNL